MYDFFNKLRGNVAVSVSGAKPEAILNLCAKEGIEIMSAVPEDEFTLLIRISARDEKKLFDLAPRAQCSIERLAASGVTSMKGRLKKRFVAVILLAACVCVLLSSRFYIWEINVTGNETVTTGEILAALRDCGVEIGSFWPNFTSDNIRSELLVHLPELAWATVNIYGSRAEVIVRERVQVPEMLDESNPADIIATKAGMITEVQALIGDAAVFNGTAVIEGELLISGEMKSSYAGSRTVHAYGEVTAYTWYELTASMPLASAEKSYTGGETSRYALNIGGSRMNFYGNSSIYEEGCDKIYDEWTLAIEGLFTLPVSITREKSVFYEINEAERDMELAKELLERALRDTLLSEIGESGEILAENYSVSVTGDEVIVCLRAQCLEQIGKTVSMTQERLWEIESRNSATKETE